MPPRGAGPDQAGSGRGRGGAVGEWEVGLDDDAAAEEAAVVGGEGEGEGEGGVMGVVWVGGGGVVGGEGEEG